MRERKNGTVRDLKARFKKWSRWIRANVPPGGRAVLGVLFIIGGVFGFLPILGFWMIPLGIAVLAMDISALVRALKSDRDRR